MEKTQCEQVDFDSIIDSIVERITANLKSVLIEVPTFKEPDSILTIKEASVFLGMTVQTLSQKLPTGEIDFMKRGQQLYFSRTKLMEYLTTRFGLGANEIQPGIKKGLPDG